MYTTIEEAEENRTDFLLSNLKETGFLLPQDIQPHWGHNGQVFTAWNQQYITMQAKERGYSDPRYWTFKQANDAGFRIKKGAKAIHSGRLVEYDTNLHSIYNNKNAAAAAKNKGITLDEYKKQFKENKFQTVSLYNAAEVVGVTPMKEISEKDKKNMLNAFLKYNCEKYQVGIEEFDKDNELGFYQNQLNKLAAAVVVSKPDLKPEVSEISRMIWVSERMHEAGFPKDVDMSQKINSWTQNVSTDEAKEVFDTVNYMTSAARFNGLGYQNIKNVNLLSKANAKDREVAEGQIVEKSDKYPEIAVPKMIYDEISEAVTERLFVQQGLSRYMTKDEFDRILSQNVNQLRDDIMEKQKEKIAAVTQEEGANRISDYKPEQQQPQPEQQQPQPVKSENLAQKIIAQRQNAQKQKKEAELAVAQ